MPKSYDAILFVSFGGPEGPDDVIPFLENVLRGRNVPRKRMLEVAEHYQQFGGVSPLNAQVRDLTAAVEGELRRHDIELPLYWGNRNWHPLLPETLREMTEKGVRRALALVVSAYSSYSSCRQYLENIDAAREAVGDAAPVVDKIRVFFNHPDFIAASADRVGGALGEVPDSRRDAAHIAFTAHSIPESMSQDCDYVTQLAETSRLVAEELGVDEDRWRLVYQSRSGRPQDAWLEPDVVDHVRQLGGEGVSDVVVAPIGFLSDHMEVIFDLDHEAAQAAREVGLNMVRAPTVGTHPGFVTTIRKLIQERLDGGAPREAIGRFGPRCDQCAVGCCPAPRRGR